MVIDLINYQMLDFKYCVIKRLIKIIGLIDLTI